MPRTPPRKGPYVKPPTFPKDLVDLLQNEPDVIRIDFRGGNASLSIPSTAQLEKKLKKYFAHSSYTSLQRQLNNFGFAKTDRLPGAACYQKVRGPRVAKMDDLLPLRPLPSSTATPRKKKKTTTTKRKVDDDDDVVARPKKASRVLLIEEANDDEPIKDDGFFMDTTEDPSLIMSAPPSPKEVTTHPDDEADLPSPPADMRQGHHLFRRPSTEPKEDATVYKILPVVAAPSPPPPHSLASAADKKEDPLLKPLEMLSQIAISLEEDEQHHHENNALLTKMAEHHDDKDTKDDVAAEKKTTLDMDDINMSIECLPFDDERSGPGPGPDRPQTPTTTGANPLDADLVDVLVATVLSSPAASPAKHELLLVVQDDDRTTVKHLPPVLAVRRGADDVVDEPLHLGAHRPFACFFSSDSSSDAIL